jgi:hypothetical protein
MKILDTEELYKPRGVKLTAMATYDVNLGARVLSKLELFSKEKNIQLNKEECTAILEAIHGEGWLIHRYETREDYQPYKIISGSIDGNCAGGVMSIFDSDATSEIK